MRRNKLIVLIVGAAVVLGAGGALAESESEDEGMSFAEACEVAGGEYTLDEETGANDYEECDLGDGYGVSCIAGTEECIEWGWEPAEQATPPADPAPSGGVGHSTDVPVEERTATEPGGVDGPDEPLEAEPSSGLSVRDDGAHLEGRTASSDGETDASEEADDDDPDDEEGDEGAREGSDEPSSGGHHGARPFTRSPGQHAK